MTVADVISEAVILLNDPGKQLYTDSKMLPLVKKAYRELGVELINNGAQFLNEVSPVITVQANATSLGSDQPSDINSPIRMQERGVGEDTFVEMEEKYWEPTYEKGPSLNYWSWREGKIVFLGATTAREVLLYYRKSPAEIVDGTTTISYPDGILYLSPRAAALAARHVGRNMAVANGLDGDAALNLTKLISRTVKNTQNLTSRRKSYWQYLRTRQNEG